MEMSSRGVENQEALSREPINTLESTGKPYTRTELISDPIPDNPTISEPSFPSHEMPPSSPLPSFDRQPKQCGQDDMAMDVDNDLDSSLETASDSSAMILDESKPIHPFFKESFPKSSSSFVNAMSMKGCRKRQREGDNDEPLNQTLSNLAVQNVGIGRSTTASRALNEKVANGSFVLNPTRWKHFQEKIYLLDRHAILNESEPKSVRHSKCRKLLQMKEPYNVANFETHIAKCKITTASNTLTKMFKKEPSQKRAKIERQPSTQIPCPGLSGSNHPRIPLYLERTPATGGGSSRIDKVSETLYPKTPYTNLSTKKQQDVIAAQRLHWRWRNEHDLQKVYSTECNKVARTFPFSDSVEPCYQCTALLNDERFIKVLSKEKPDPENVKYTPKIWINNDAVEKWGNIRGLMPIIQEFEKVIAYIYPI